MVPIALVAGIVLHASVAAADDKPANAMCPVLPDEAAEPEFRAVYKGREIDFCCTTCVADFRKEPQKYIKKLPQFANIEKEEADALAALGPATNIGPPKVVDERTALARRDSTTMRIFRRVWPYFAVTLPLFIAAQILARRKWRVPHSIWVHSAFCVLLGAVGWTYAWGLDAKYMQRLWNTRDRVHFATYFDFGIPPVPERPKVEPTLARTYYRGNDERSPKLFNNGYYRTSTFHLSLVGPDKKPFQAGDLVAGKPLFVRLEIVRAPFTPDRFFNEKTMSRAYLTRQNTPFLGASEPIKDRVNLTTLEPMQRWEALYPIGHAPPAAPAGFDLNKAPVDALARIDGVGPTFAAWTVKYRDFNGPIRSWKDLELAGIPPGPRERLVARLADQAIEGVIYVAQLVYENEGSDQVIGSRFHYGIKYDLHLREGRLTPDSEVWMNFLYRSRKISAWKLPASEWFSPEPIPELPSKGVDDEKLLGLDELATEG